MKKIQPGRIKIAILIGVLVIIVWGFFVYLAVEQKPKKAEPITTNSAGIYPLSDPWPSFEKFKTFVEVRDQVGMNSVSYNQYSSCRNEQECESFFNLFSLGVSSVNKEDYAFQYEDEKQIILTSDFRKSKNEEDTIYTKYFLFFTKENGEIKFLGGNHEGEAYIAEGSESLTEEQIDADLKAKLADTDTDGLIDSKENCENYSQRYEANCLKNDPLKKDTDGDGWWDGIQNEFIKQNMITETE